MFICIFMTKVLSNNKILSILGYQNNPKQSSTSTELDLNTPLVQDDLSDPLKSMIRYK